MDFQKYKYKKIVVLAALLLFACFLYWLIGSSNGKNVILRFSVRSSAQEGWNWISNYRVDFQNPMVPAIIKMVNDRQCGGITLVEMMVQGRWGKFSDHLYYPAYERLFSDWKSYKVSDSVKEAMNTPQEGYNKILPEAMYCDQIPVSEDFENITFKNLGEETGYDLTRKFWAASLFKKNGCITQNYNIDEVISSAAKKMAEAQELNEVVDDLYMERTAFLLGYGFRELVKEDWIRNIMDAQDKTGAWLNPTFFDKNFKDAQTSMMAIWALSEYVGYCPLSTN